MYIANEITPNFLYETLNRSCRANTRGILFEGDHYSYFPLSLGAFSNGVLI